MTPQRIADISEPIEQIYSDMTDELLLNIAKHLSSPTWTWTALSEIETLQQMGQLTEENTKIINSYVQKIPQAVKDAMNDSRLQALSEIEEKLAQAALNGYLVEPVTDGTADVAKAFSAQALSQLNLVNQTMLNSSLQAYQSGVYTMRQGMTTIADDTQLEEAQSIIDIAAGKTVLGTDTRTGALRTALKQLNYNGITGFYDRIGRSWSAEAYVNMDIRTTVHNTYIQSIKTRQEDYGSDVFQVSAHAGARPLCYPYQGKLYSWGNSGGYITLGDGKRYRFGSIKETSYGQPAGLFGINCGHVPYPMIPSVSEPVDEKIPPKAENDKEYQESQQQRTLERRIRYQKRELEMLGDLATDADKAKLKAAQAQMREFIKQTGRTRRYDREQIVTETSEAYFVRDKNKASALKTMRQYGDSVSLKNLSLRQMNDINEQLGKLTSQYPSASYQAIKQDNRITAIASSNYKVLNINSNKLTDADRRQKEIWDNNRLIAKKGIAYLEKHYGTAIPSQYLADYKQYKEIDKYTRANVGNAYGTKGVITHEYAHKIADQYFGQLNKHAAPDTPENQDKRNLVDNVYNIAMSNGDVEKISYYAAREPAEFLAEAFTAKVMGETLPDYISDMIDEVMKP